MPAPTTLEILDRYAADDRPRMVTLALRQLARRAAKDFVLIARLAYEAHDQGYWSKVKKPDGTAYLTEEEFFSDVLALSSWRTANKRIAVGRAIAALPEGEPREAMAERIAGLGAAKASVVAPVLEADPASLAVWVDRAAAMPIQELQQAVSQERGAAPRGRPSGDRVESFLRSVLPDIQSRELFDDFLRLGRRRLDGRATCLAVLIHAMQEVLPEWSQA